MTSIIHLSVRYALLGTTIATALGAHTTVTPLGSPVEWTSNQVGPEITASWQIVDPYEGLYASRGAAYRTVVRHSHYNAPIVPNGQLRGNSRIWGDAAIETQRDSIDAIRAAAKVAGMTLEQEAMVLAIARVESGFNPDAAAGTTSAQGLGQFIRKTGSAYGLTDQNRWDIQVQARALVAHTMDNYAAAEQSGLGSEYVYARHHDGSFNNEYGGLDLARERVIPTAQKILVALGGYP